MHLYIVRCNSPKAVEVVSGTLDRNAVSFVRDRIEWKAHDMRGKFHDVFVEKKNVILILHEIFCDSSELEQYIQISRDENATYSIVDVRDEKSPPLPSIPEGFRYAKFKVDDSDRLLVDTEAS
jgi:hypothetical protein